MVQAVEDKSFCAEMTWNPSISNAKVGLHKMNLWVMCDIIPKLTQMAMK